jgi:membrane protease YdiL (CAAX protease family)
VAGAAVYETAAGEAVLDVSGVAELAAPRMAARELAAITIAAVYLLGPWRTLGSDVAAFVLGWVVVRVSGRALFPAPSSAARAARAHAWIAGMTAIAFAALIAIGRAQGTPLRPGQLLLTCALYVPFAWMQQEVTQRYLVARLGRMVGGRSDLLTAGVGGVVFGLCHLPFAGLTAPTLIAGVAWGCAFLATGRILPIVLSHALLGGSYFLLVLGRDPFVALRQVL